MTQMVFHEASHFMRRGTLFFHMCRRRLSVAVIAVNSGIRVSPTVVHARDHTPWFHHRLEPGRGQACQLWVVAAEDLPPKLFAKLRVLEVSAPPSSPQSFRSRWPLAPPTHASSIHRGLRRNTLELVPLHADVTCRKTE